MEVEPADDWPQSMTRRPWSSASETAFVWGTDHGGAAEATMRDNVDREVPADVSDSLRSYRGIEQLAGGEDIVMQDAFDLGPRIDAEWQAAKVFVIDTNVLISNLSLLEYTAHLLADARRENIPGSRNCCLVIPKMVRVELDSLKKPHKASKAISVIVEAPPETVPSHISIHSPEAHRVALLQKTKQTISMTLGEATKNAQRWMTRMLESGDRVVRYQKMDEVFADLEGAARQGQGGRLLASPDQHILDCARYIHSKVGPVGGDVALLSNDRALCLDATTEDIKTLAVTQNLTPLVLATYMVPSIMQSPRILSRLQNKGMIMPPYRSASCPDTDASATVFSRPAVGSRQSSNTRIATTQVASPRKNTTQPDNSTLISQIPALPPLPNPHLAAEDFELLAGPFSSLGLLFNGIRSAVAIALEPPLRQLLRILFSIGPAGDDAFQTACAQALATASNVEHQDLIGTMGWDATTCFVLEDNFWDRITGAACCRRLLQDAPGRSSQDLDGKLRSIRRRLKIVAQDLAPVDPEVQLNGGQLAWTPTKWEVFLEELELAVRDCGLLAVQDEAVVQALFRGWRTEMRRLSGIDELMADR